MKEQCECLITKNHSPFQFGPQPKERCTKKAGFLVNSVFSPEKMLLCDGCLFQAIKVYGEKNLKIKELKKIKPTVLTKTNYKNIVEAIDICIHQYSKKNKTRHLDKMMALKARVKEMAHEKGFDI